MSGDGESSSGRSNGMADPYLHGLGVPLGEFKHRINRQKRPSKIVTSSTSGSDCHGDGSAAAPATFTTGSAASISGAEFTPPTPHSSAGLQSPANAGSATSRGNSHASFTPSTQLFFQSKGVEHAFSSAPRGLGMLIDRKDSTTSTQSLVGGASTRLSAASQNSQQQATQYKSRPLSTNDCNVSGGPQLAASKMNTHPLMQRPFSVADRGGSLVDSGNRNSTAHHISDLGKNLALVRIAKDDTKVDTLYDDSSQHIGKVASSPSDKSGLPSVSIDSSSTIVTPPRTSPGNALPDYSSAKGDLLSADEPVLSYKWQLARDENAYTEVVEGGHRALEHLNSPDWQFSEGSRVVCIKADFVENVQWSIQTGKWITIDKVGDRIMQLWDILRDTKDQVVLLFSVNSLKSYCGVAELRGPWKEAEVSHIWRWEQTPDQRAKGQLLGTLPIEWKFVKNVAYDHFKHIKHAHNGQPITNMWNGMHFPVAYGREVIQIYTSKPHFTNLLTRPTAWPYDPMKGVNRAIDIDPSLESKFYPMSMWNNRPRAKDVASGTLSKHGRCPQAHTSNLHRRGRLQADMGREDAEKMSTPSIRGYPRADSDNVNHLDGQASPTPRSRNPSRRLFDVPAVPSNTPCWEHGERSGFSPEPPEVHDNFQDVRGQMSGQQGSSMPSSRESAVDMIGDAKKTVAPGAIPASYDKRGYFPNGPTLSMDPNGKSKVGYPSQARLAARTSGQNSYKDGREGYGVLQQARATEAPSTPVRQMGRSGTAQWGYVASDASSNASTTANTGENNAQQVLKTSKPWHVQTPGPPGSPSYDSGKGLGLFDFQPIQDTGLQLLCEELLVRKRDIGERKKMAEMRKREAAVAFEDALTELREADDEDMETDSQLHSLQQQQARFLQAQIQQAQYFQAQFQQVLAERGLNQYAFHQQAKQQQAFDQQVQSHDTRCPPTHAQVHHDPAHGRSFALFSGDNHPDVKTQSIPDTPLMGQHDAIYAPLASTENVVPQSTGCKQISNSDSENDELKTAMKHLIKQIEEGTPKSSQQIQSAVNELTRTYSHGTLEKAGLMVRADSRSNARSNSGGQLFFTSSYDEMSAFRDDCS